MQVAMKIVLKHFLKKIYSLKKLDKLTGRHKNYWTWTTQIVSVLHDLGLKVKYYSKTDVKLFLRGEEFVRKHYQKKEADKILKYTDMPVFLDSIKNLMKYDLFEAKKLSFSDIEKHIIKGHLSLILIDHNVVAGKKGIYNGHLVVVTGFDDKHVYYHEPHPDYSKPNRKVLKKTFIKAWNAKGTENDVVIVFGKR